MSRTPPRPVLRYHGGKWKLAPWVISHFPEHGVYVEPFGGAASVLMRKPRVGAEIYNDLDDDVVNIFRILRDPAQACELRRRVELTPFARTELRDAYLDPADRMDAAHKMLIRSFMGFGSAAMTRTHMTGFRSSSMRSEGRKPTTPAIDWKHWPYAIEAIADRLRGVVIECRPAELIIAQHDGPNTLIYADPPYVPDTRSSLQVKNGNGMRSGATRGTSGHYYRHDMTEADHRALASVLREARGMVVLSGYPSTLYDELYPDWKQYTVQHRADGARERTEVLWLNEAAQERRSARRQVGIFEQAPAHG